MTETYNLEQFIKGLQEDAHIAKNIEIALFSSGMFQVYNRDNEQKDFFKVDFETGTLNLYGDKTGKTKVSPNSVSKDMQNIIEFAKLSGIFVELPKDLHNEELSYLGTYDKDGDGTPDPDDGTPYGNDGTSADRGQFPALDTDGDGIPDIRDPKPNVAEDEGRDEP